MSKGMVDHLRAMREAKAARNAERAKVEAGIRRAAAEGKALLELAPLKKSIKRKLAKAIEATAERMKNKPAKGKRKKK